MPDSHQRHNVRITAWITRILLLTFRRTLTREKIGPNQFSADQTNKRTHRRKQNTGGRITGLDALYSSCKHTSARSSGPNGWIETSLIPVGSFNLCTCSYAHTNTHARMWCKLSTGFPPSISFLVIQLLSNLHGDSPLNPRSNNKLWGEGWRNQTRNELCTVCRKLSNMLNPLNSLMIQDRGCFLNCLLKIMSWKHVVPWWVHTSWVSRLCQYLDNHSCLMAADCEQTVSCLYKVLKYCTHNHSKFLLPKHLS